MKDIAVFDGFKCVEHDDSEVFFISPHLKIYSQVELRRVLKDP